MKKLLSAILLCFAALSTCLLTSCGKKEIIVGTMAQPGQPILEFVKSDFEAQTGYKLTIKLYTDFATPNVGLNGGEVDANLFQHLPFLQTYNANNNTNLVKACNMYDCAYGGYSKDISNISELQSGDVITIASDGSNMKRCLDILVAEGVITVDYDGKAAKDLNPDNVNDYITSNPKGVVIRPMLTTLIAASLDDADVKLGIVNATFAIAAGLGNSATLVCQEQDPNHVNTNILACRAADLESDWLKTLVSLLTSEKTDAFINQTFGQTLTPYHN